MFKLLKFVTEYKEFVYLASDFSIEEVKNTMKKFLFERKFSENSYEVLDNALMIVIKISGFFYYLLVNILWVVNVGVISKHFVHHQLMKGWKNIFSLIKNYFQMFRSIIELFKAK